MRDVDEDNRSKEHTSVRRVQTFYLEVDENGKARFADSVFVDSVYSGRVKGFTVHAFQGYLEIEISGEIEVPVDSKIMLQPGSFMGEPVIQMFSGASKEVYYSGDTISQFDVYESSGMMYSLEAHMGAYKEYALGNISYAEYLSYCKRSGYEPLDSNVRLEKKPAIDIVVEFLPKLKNRIDDLKDSVKVLRDTMGVDVGEE